MHGGNLRWAEEKYGKGHFVDLSANINVFGPPSGVVQKLNQALPQIVQYPDPESLNLRYLMSEAYTLPIEHILIGNGAGELIFTILQALKPRKVLIPIPAFSEYEKAGRASGAEIFYFTLGASGWESLNQVYLKSASDYKEIWHNNLLGVNMVFLCSPHNPTGSILKREQLKIILDIAMEMKCWVFFDESFYDFLPDEWRWSSREFLKDYPNLISIYSLTKFYSLPGLRLGVAFAQPELIKRFQLFRDPWSVNIFAQAAGIASLEDTSYPIEIRRKISASREFFYKEFNNHKFTKWRLLPSHVNFALIELIEGKSKELTAALGNKRILVRDCKNFSGLNGEFIRVAIKDIESTQRFLQALVEIETI